MFRAELTRTKAVAAALAVSAVLAPAATAQQDLRSPDARDAAASSIRQDLRSPDARDAAVVPPSPPQRRFTDLRSPDARDAGRPQPFVVHSTSPASTGFDWGDAGIGAAIVAGVLAMVLGGLGVRRRHGHHPRPISV
jgi:hypothetical protein